ncbi:MAG: type II toxin-antitoxin system RelE/ParE family toxin, partial [Chloroflexi bacterium]|nr:type II toxin-antitoxin system RelE/ParE family toxin [Chloroflexota bacterium]
MYFFFTGRWIVFLHGFQKKTPKTPRREIEIAEKRVNDQPLKRLACPWRCTRRFGDSSSDGGCIRD